MNSARQIQDGESPIALHSEFGPQGDGLQGSVRGGSSTTKSFKFRILKIFQINCILTNWYTS